MINYNLFEKNLREIVLPEFIGRITGERTKICNYIKKFPDCPDVFWKNGVSNFEIFFVIKSDDIGITDLYTEVQDLSKNNRINIENMNLVHPLMITFHCKIYGENGIFKTGTSGYWNIKYKNCLFSRIEPTFLGIYFENCVSMV